LYLSFCHLFYRRPPGASVAEIAGLRRKAANDGLVVFDSAEQGNRFLRGSTRPAHFLLLLTISEQHPRYSQCQSCVQALKGFRAFTGIWVSSATRLDPPLVPVVFHLDKMPEFAQMVFYYIYIYMYIYIYIFFFFFFFFF
jgi:hypothetical protein